MSIAVSFEESEARSSRVHCEMRIPPALQALAVVAALYALVCVVAPSVGVASDGPLALESTKERVERLEDEAKAKTIESRIRQTAARLERERAEQEKSAAAAERSRKGAIDDKREAEDDFAKARELSSAAVREKQQARLERQRAQSAEEVLSLKTRVASLLKQRATDEDRRAGLAQQEVDKVKARVQAVRSEIARLQREAKIKHVEADERVAVGQRLLASAKKLSVKAKALQEEHLQTHQITGKLVVSKQALELMKREARRVGHLLQVDSSGLKKAEKLVASLPAQPDNPLGTIHKRIESTRAQLQTMSANSASPDYVESSKGNPHKNMHRPSPKHDKIK